MGFKCQCVGPCGPTGLVAADIFQMHAINRTNGQTQFATGTHIFDDGVHPFVGADDGVYRACFSAQGASDAPILVNPNHMARPLLSMRWIQWHRGLAGDQRQSAYAFITAWWTLVDGSVLFGNGFGVGGTVRKTTSGALCLGQYPQNFFGQRHRVQAGVRRRTIEVLAVVRRLATVWDGLAGFFAVFLWGLWCDLMNAQISG